MRCQLIFADNPPLVIQAICKTYISTLDKTKQDEVLKRGLTYSMNAANNRRQEEMAYRHSEADLNAWGYSLMQLKRLVADLYLANQKGFIESIVRKDCTSEASGLAVIERLPTG